jgi:hypothetical protein
MTPADCLTFEVPWSDVEIVAFIEKDGAAGIAYHPRILNSTIPWSSACPHCFQGKPTKLGPGARQAIKVMCSARRHQPNKYQFVLSPQYLATGKMDRDGWTIKVRRPDKRLILDVIQLTGQPPASQGPTQEFRSAAVVRGLRLILSGRVPSAEEIKACVRGLRSCPSSLTPCWKWAKNL